MSRTQHDVINRRPIARRLAGAALLATALVAACSSSSDDNVGVVASLSVTGGNGQSGAVATALTSALTVKATDASGNAVSGAVVNFTATGGAVLSSSTATTNATGNATINVTLGQTAGIDTVRASVSGVSAAAIFTAQATAGAAATLAIASGNNQTALHGALLTSPLVVLVHDQYGNAVANATVNWTTTFGVLGTASSTSDSTGKAQNSWTLSPLVGADSATATLSGTSSVVIFTATGN